MIYYLRTAPLEERRFNRKIRHDSHRNLYERIFLKNFDGNLSRENCYNLGEKMEVHVARAIRVKAVVLKGKE